MAPRKVVFIMEVMMLTALLLVPALAKIAFPASGCLDGDDRCPTLAQAGECSDASTYMTTVCRFSCGQCSSITTGFYPYAAPAPAAPASAVHDAPPLSAPAPPAVSFQQVDSAHVPRRSIVNPDFECGGAHLASGQTRLKRQASFPERPRQDSPFFAFGSGGDSGVQAANLASCGASVIHERYLVTAAYCVLGEKLTKVRLGDLDLGQDGEANSAPADYTIIETIFPSDFNNSMRYNDIALLKTERKIDFDNPVVFPLCVSAAPPTIATEVTAAGFGFINETHKSTHLMEARLQVQPMSECEQRYLMREEQRLRQAYPSLLQGRDGLFCVGDNHSGLCQGDEGGPVFREDEKGRRFLEGITSFTGSFCGPGLLPGLATAIADYVDFIDSVIYGDDAAARP